MKVYISYPKGISSKVNVIAQVEFELAYYDVVATTPQELIRQLWI